MIKELIKSLYNYYFKEEQKVLDLNEKLIAEYPTKDIYYLGRVLPTTKQKINVPVNVLITSQDLTIKNDLISWNLYQTNEDPETLIPKIYKAYMQKHYKYKYDSENWNGLNELWEFPFELYEKYGAGKWEADCDSHAIALVSYLRCAGILAGYVWVVVGDCKLGGHATLYAYGKDGKFHHLNSTGATYFNSVSEYPTHEDAQLGNDAMGISNVWLSFNDLVSRSEFNGEKIGGILIK